MMESLRYVVAVLVTGLIAVYVSENLFWSAPRADFSHWELLGAWGFYSAGTACALSAVAFTGCSGWRGLFLGGAIVGFVVEGVIVDTMYDAFPLQLVWTPLAWHALLTGMLIGGAARMAGAQGLAVVAFGGVFCGVWAQYWPIELDGVPAPMATTAYILGAGLALPVGHWVLNRLGHVPRPHGAVLLVAPVLVAALWLFKLVGAPFLQKAALPVLLGLTVWAMWRLGRRNQPVGFGAPLGPLRLAATLLVPVLMLAVALPGWAAFPAGISVNIPLALATGAISLILFLVLIWQAMYAERKAPAQDQSRRHKVHDPR
jgi:hypothetical protein